VSLGTEADHGAGFSLEELQIGILVSVDFGGHVLVVGWFEVKRWKGGGYVTF
jgi:hypothetical protein